MTLMNARLDFLIGSESAIQLVMAHSDHYDFESKINFFITDVLNYLLEQKMITLPFQYSILETSFSGLIQAAKIGLINDFDASWQYLILYSLAREDSIQMQILLEDSWFEVNVDESQRFIDLGTFLAAVR